MDRCLYNLNDRVALALACKELSNHPEQDLGCLRRNIEEVITAISAPAQQVGDVHNEWIAGNVGRAAFHTIGFVVATLFSVQIVVVLLCFLVILPGIFLYIWMSQLRLPKLGTPSEDAGKGEGRKS